MTRIRPTLLRPAILAGIALCAAAIAPATAFADTLDQQQTASNADGGVGSSQTVAQTFTAGISGGLDRVDLLLDYAAPPTDPLTVEIRNGSGTGPGLTVLATGVIPASSVGATAAFVPVSFASPAPVTAGSQYSIVAQSGDTSNNYAWFYKDSDVYAAGDSFFTSDSPPTASTTWIKQGGVPGFDQAFKTYVVPPVVPPASPASTGQRAAASKKCKKKAKKKHWSNKQLKKCKKKANKLPV